jgi:hypothetical protein
VINMGGANAQAQERERDDLVNTLRAGVLPARARVVDARYVAPALTSWMLWLARALGALVGGVLAGLVTWIAVRALRPECRIESVPAGRASIAARVAWTIGGVVAMLVGSEIALPWINEAELLHVVRGAGGFLGMFNYHTSVSFSLFALGLLPLVTGTVTVELVALVVPRWRALRDRGPEGRRKLARASAVVTLGLAFIQAYFLAVYLQRLGGDVVAGDLQTRLLIALTLTAGTAALIAIASVIGQRGLGNGYAVLFVGGWIAHRVLYAPATGDGRLVPLAFAAAAIASIAAITVALTRWRVRTIGGHALPLPTAGYVPLSDAGGLTALVTTASALGVTAIPEIVYRLFGTLKREPLAIVAIVVATVAWSFAFARPGRRKDVLERAVVAPVDARAWWRATALSGLALVAIYAIEHVTQLVVPQVGALVEATTLMFVVATIVDVAAEVRARRAGELVPVWPLHDPLLADTVRDKLASAGIHHHLKSARLRTLLWLFGPYVPIVVLVAADRADDARRALGELFE